MSLLSKIGGLVKGVARSALGAATGGISEALIAGAKKLGGSGGGAKGIQQALTSSAAAAAAAGAGKLAARAIPVVGTAMLAYDVVKAGSGYIKSGAPLAASSAAATQLPLISGGKAMSLAGTIKSAAQRVLPGAGAVGAGLAGFGVGMAADGTMVYTRRRRRGRGFTARDLSQFRKMAKMMGQFEVKCKKGASRC